MENIPRKCAVCEEKQYKYRCPKCRILYCSVPCFKEHKSEGSCEKESLKPISDGRPVKEEIAREDGEVSGGDEDMKEESTPDELSQEQLNKLDESDTVKDLLQNPHLRVLVTQLDQAKEKDKAIERVMQEPIFVEFADACLAATIGQDQDAVSDR
nr:zinc finger HIT domain-containing protein 3-like [Lytechinus pictus]